ncbi:MAG TPA: SDR family NAD(P)-dependent oxidoreductase, partial [Roseiflexaceae bacterium]|nr:SDR family NAD(P)-dependent oxidoreductase [Roseiflexaceae bacterium]
PELCVVAGPRERVAAFQARLEQQEVSCRPLHVSQAFHSPLVEPILDAFRQQVQRVSRHAPQLPIASNLTGGWLTAEEATSVDYWVQQARQPVRFAEGLRTLEAGGASVLLEVGPGHSLSALARQQRGADTVVQPSMPHPQEAAAAEGQGLWPALAGLWLAGVELDWSAGQAGRRRVPLPTYPFERQRYWVEAGSGRPPTPKPAPVGPEQWSYVPAWRPSQPPRLPDGLDAHAPLRWLVLSDEAGVCAPLIEQLRQAGHAVVSVRAGERFRAEGNSAFELPPGSAHAYDLLLEALGDADLLPDRVVHAWSLLPLPAKGSPEARFSQAQQQGFLSLLRLMQALDRAATGEPLRLTVLTKETHHVTELEAVAPERATIVGLCTVLPQEHPHLDCVQIDLAGTGMRRARERDALLAELLAPPSDRRIAYRGAQRWVETYEPLALPDVRPTPLRADGVYLIIGGLGRIGLALAQHIAAVAPRATLILAGRSAFPERDTWERWCATHEANDGTAQTIRALQAIEAAGSTVQLARLDIADEAQIQKLCALIDARHGALHGVVHAAGLVGEQSIQLIHELDEAACARHFNAKVAGTRALEAALGDRPLDFCLFCSSLAAVLGGLGFAAYSAANVCLDRMIHQHNQGGGTPWVGINWDSWQFAHEQTLTGSAGHVGIRPEQGCALVERVLAAPALAHVVTSTSALQERIDQWIARRTAGAEQEAAGGGLHERPTLQTVYVAPANDVEHVIVGVWQELLGVAPVGLHDSFLDLGGHSLLATRLIARLREVFQIDLPLRSLYEATTVAEQAAMLHAHEQQPGRLAAIARLHREVEQMTPEQVQAMLLERQTARRTT